MHEAQLDLEWDGRATFLLQQVTGQRKATSQQAEAALSVPGHPQMASPSPGQSALV